MLGRFLKTISVLLLLSLAAAAQTIPAGTHLTVRVGSEISSGTAKAGDRFDATLARSLVVNGKTLARTGAPVRGKVTSAKSSGRLHAPGELALRLTSVQVNWQDGSDHDSLLFCQGQESYQEQRDEDWRRSRGRSADWRPGRRRKGRGHRRARRRRRRNRRGGCDGQRGSRSPRRGVVDVYNHDGSVGKVGCPLRTRAQTSR